MKQEVELLSVDPSAVAAVRATLAMAPLSAELAEEDGRWFIVGSDFACWAAVQQGYVKRAVPKATP